MSRKYYDGLNDFVKCIQAKNELLCVSEFVSPKYEISEFYDRVVKTSGKALMFQNTGSKFPLLINMFGSDNRLNTALSVESLNDIEAKIEAIFQEFADTKINLWDKLKILPSIYQLSSLMPKFHKTKGKCQEVIMPIPSLDELPILTCWPHDGGRFITLPLVHTMHPVSGALNIGMYRMQVIDSKTTAMHWHLHKTGASHYRAYKQCGMKMPVTVILGGDPVYTYSATAPLPENVNEYMLAGLIKGAGVKLVKCITNDIYVPDDADFVIEGYIDTQEELFYEGPFGDHTGYYSLPDYYPIFHITCVTHRKNAIYPATVVGIPPQEDGWLGKATEKIFLSPLRYGLLPEVVDYYMPEEGGFHNLVIVKIKSEYPGHAQKVINALWGMGQMMFAKVIVVVNENVDIRNPENIIQLLNQSEVNKDFIYAFGPSDVLDHASLKFAFGGKLGVDLTACNLNVIDNRKLDDYIQVVDQIEMKNIEGGVFKGKSCLIIKLKRGCVFDKEECLNALMEKDVLPKFILIVDDDINYINKSLFLWRMLSNIDPQKDVIVMGNSSNTMFVLIDATAKPQSDIFERKWPNIVCSDDKTIERVDSIMKKIGLTHLESFSKKIKKQGDTQSAYYFPD